MVSHWLVCHEAQGKLRSDPFSKIPTVVLVVAFDRLARSARHFLNLIDELESLQIEGISRRENIDTCTPMGRLFVTIISSIAELELDLIRERVRAGMRRAKLEGRQIGRARLDVDREQIINDRLGMSLTAVAKKHGISRASVCRIVQKSNEIQIPVWTGESVVESR